MLSLSYNLSPILKTYLAKIDDLRAKILCAPLSLADETYLRFYATVDRIYYSLLLSGEEVTREEVILHLRGGVAPQSNVAGTFDVPPAAHLGGGSRIIGYKKALDYISQNWKVSSEKVKPATINDLYQKISANAKTISNRFLSNLTNYAQVKPEHPVIESAVAQIGLLKIHDNALLSRLLALLFLYKYGYDFRGFLVLEKHWYKDLTGFNEKLKQFMENDNITLWLEYFAHSMILELENVLSHLRGGVAPQSNVAGTFDVPPAAHLGGVGSRFWNLNERQKKILTYLDMPNATITNRIVQNICNISQITAARDLAKLTAMGLLFTHGGGRATHYTRA